jgi:hypothetical protein
MTDLDRTTTYLTAAARSLTDPHVTGPLPQQLSDRCPECGDTIDALSPDAVTVGDGPALYLDARRAAAAAVAGLVIEDYWPHVIGSRAGRVVVLIGCEGYWCLDPNRLGIEDPNWQATERTFAEALTRRLDDGTAWSEGFTTDEINRPAVQ